MACVAHDGSLLWHDPQMPRVMALCLTADKRLVDQVRALSESVRVHPVLLASPIPGLQVHAAPASHRRKLSAWLVILARTAAIPATSEELAHLAQKASMDALMLVQQSQKIPLVGGGGAAPFLTLATLAEQMHDDLQAAGSAHHELAGVTEQLTSTYEEMSLLYKISSGMRFSQKPEAFLASVCREVQEIGNFGCVAVAMARNADGVSSPELDEWTVYAGSCPILGKELLRMMHRPIYEALTFGESQVHNEITADCDGAALRALMKRFVCVPLKRDQRPLGILVAIDKNDSTKFNSVDLNLLNNVGNQCSIFLENAALYQDMQDLFMGVLHSLTRSIDAKDAYTRGHSHRVAELSRDLARKIGLSEKLCERVYLAGLLHDVGKIGVPEAVLRKPGELTAEEIAAIQKHPEIGAQILGNIKQLQDVLPGVLHHHERWDGQGYPHGKSGEGIPLIGRIICVADSFDAMSSTRIYRSALMLEAVLEEIKRCAGSQFDPALAKVFATLDFSRYERAIKDRNIEIAAAGSFFHV